MAVPFEVHVQRVLKRAFEDNAIISDYKLIEALQSYPFTRFRATRGGRGFKLALSRVMIKHGFVRLTQTSWKRS